MRTTIIALTKNTKWIHYSNIEKNYLKMRARLSNMQNQSHGYVIILAERHDGIKKCKWFCINAMVGLNFLLPVERLIFICSYKNSSNAEFLIIFMRLMVPLLHSVTNFLRNNYWFFSAWIYYWEYAKVENTVKNGLVYVVNNW